MRLLLDTHIWIWAELEPARISPAVSAVLQDARNELWLSPISPWELIYLYERKRVRLDRDAQLWAREIIQSARYREAPITHEVALMSHTMRLPQRDPADRILAATSLIYGLTLVTVDEHLLACPGLSTLPIR